MVGARLQEKPHWNFRYLLQQSCLVEAPSNQKGRNLCSALARNSGFVSKLALPQSVRRVNKNSALQTSYKLKNGVSVLIILNFFLQRQNEAKDIPDFACLAACFCVA